MKPLELPYTAVVGAETTHEHSTPDTRVEREKLNARIHPERATRSILMQAPMGGKRNIEEDEDGN